MENITQLIKEYRAALSLYVASAATGANEFITGLTDELNMLVAGFAALAGGVVNYLEKKRKQAKEMLATEKAQMKREISELKAAVAAARSDD